MLPIETVLTKERMFLNPSPWAQFCKIWACSLFGHMQPQLICLYMIAVVLDPLCSYYLEISLSNLNLRIWKMDYFWVAWFQLNQTDLASSYFRNQYEPVLPMIGFSGKLNICTLWVVPDRVQCGL
jgi:hypothetical protein